MLLPATDRSNNANKCKMSGEHMFNFVEIVGRLGNRVNQKELPGGDIATIFVVVVERSPRDQVGKMKIYTVPCQTFRASVAQRVLRLEPDEQVICTGVSRRRF